MIPLNKLPDPDKVLPAKIDVPYNLGGNDYIIREDVGFNQAIDQYNQVMIDGDVEKLANVLIEIDGNRIDNLTFEGLSRLIIANLDKFLVVRKKSD